MCYFFDNMSELLFNLSGDQLISGLMCNNSSKNNLLTFLSTPGFTLMYVVWIYNAANFSILILHHF